MFKNIQPLLILFLLTLISYGCKKEVTPIIQHNYIKKGCIPLVLNHQHVFGHSTINYNYSSIRLDKLGSKEYHYNKFGLVDLIETLPYTFTNLFYDECNIRLIRRTTHNKHWQTGEIEMAGDYLFDYQNGKITSIKDAIRNTETKIQYNDGTNNISIKENYDNTGNLIEKIIYEYDTLNNPHLNLTVPQSVHRIESFSDNNIIKTSRIDYSSMLDTFISTCTIEYNEFGFPLKIYSDTTSSLGLREYEYTMCSE